MVNGSPDLPESQALGSLLDRAALLASTLVETASMMDWAGLGIQEIPTDYERDGDSIDFKHWLFTHTLYVYIAYIRPCVERCISPSPSAFVPLRAAKRNRRVGLKAGSTFPSQHTIITKKAAK